MSGDGMLVVAAVSVAAGLATAAVLGWLALLQRRRWRALKVLREEAQRNPDPTQWPWRAWPALQMAHVHGMQWQLHWFGQRSDVRMGVDRGLKVSLDIPISPEVRAVIEAWVPRSAELRWLADEVLNAFGLYWSVQAQARVAAVEAALRQRAEHALTLRHDLRNLMQWMDWTLQDLQRSAAEGDVALLQAARRLVEVAPQARWRAQRLHRASGALAAEAAQGKPSVGVAADPQVWVQAAAELHGAQLYLERQPCGCAQPADTAAAAPVGGIRTQTPAEVWQQVLDNIMGNAVALARQQGRTAQIHACWQIPPGGGVRLCMRMPAGADASWTQRAFEPLHSGRASGSGLGLYLARRAAQQAGGQLELHIHRESEAPNAAEAQVCFVLTLP